MRFDSTNDNQVTALELLNNSTQLDLSEMFKRFGDERFSDQLASKIVKFREGRVIQTTGELKEAIRDAFPTTSYAEKNQTIKRIF